MAITIPDKCWRQVNENDSVNDAGAGSFAYILKGNYANLNTLKGTLTKGMEVVTGWNATSWDLRRVPGGCGVLTISCHPKEDEAPDPETGETTRKPLKDVWQVKAVRNDVSMLGYCGPANNNPHREAIELWQKETDPDALAQNMYHKPDGTLEPLTSAEQALIAKIKKGIDSVVRFYPVITRTRVYSKEPPTYLESLGIVDTPPATGTLASKVAQYEWLKMQDDAIENTDGNWSRVESWWGILKSDSEDGHPWDPDLYGPNRWAMPYEH